MVVLLFAMPRTPWEFDEPLFFQALHRYDPVAHHPPPPGYPVFILVAQAVRFVIPSDFGTIVTINVIASAIAFVLFALALRNMTGSIAAGVTGALLFYFSPALLIHSTVPISEPGALALLAAALFFASRHSERQRGIWAGEPPPDPSLPLGMTRSSIIGFAAFAALTVGWRIQFSIFVVPLFVVTVLMMKSWRDRAIAVGVFTIVCLVWLTPLTVAVGGFDELVRFETAQGEYLAEHDAAVSRSGWTAPMIAFRFIAHAWGTKIASFPILILAVFGFFSLKNLPLKIAAAIYITFALWAMDPADGVRYSIPFVLAVAMFAAVGLGRFERYRYAVVALFIAGSLAYVSPVIAQRGSSASPPVAAAKFAQESLPADAVVLYELPLWPHATYYLRDHRPSRVDRGLAQYFDQPDVPLFIYADGATNVPGARTFRWRTSDAYQKLTRKHYSASSIIPVPPERRFKVVRGVHAPEREQGGREWRWLDSPAELQLPSGSPREVIIRLGLPVIYPFEGNDVVIKLNDREAARVRLERGKPVDVALRVPGGSPVVRFESRIAYVPAQLPGSLNRDPRRLAVEMYDLRSTSADAPAVRQVASR